MLDCLTARQQEVIKLKYYEGPRSDEQVGELLGVCRSAAFRCRKRALERLANQEAA